MLLAEDKTGYRQPYVVEQRGQLSCRFTNVCRLPILILKSVRQGLRVAYLTINNIHIINVSISLIYRVAGPVVQLGRFGRLVRRDVLGLLPRPLVGEVDGDSRGPECVVANPGADVGGLRPPLDQVEGVVAVQRLVGEPVGLADGRAE